MKTLYDEELVPNWKEIVPYHGTLWLEVIAPDRNVPIKGFTLTDVKTGKYYFVSVYINDQNDCNCCKEVRFGKITFCFENLDNRDSSGLIELLDNMGMEGMIITRISLIEDEDDFTSNINFMAEEEKEKKCYQTTS